jgi:hypothetical protein
MRRIVVAPALLLLVACQPQQPPRTAAPAAPQGSLSLPEADAAHRYDNIAPVDEARAPRRVAAVASARPVGARPVLSEREKQAIAAWEQEEAANRATLTVRPPPLTRSKLGLPDDAGPLPLPSLYHPPPDTPASREQAVPPPAADRPQRPRTAVPPPAPPARAAAPAPSPPPPAPPPPAPPPPAPPPPVQQAEPAPPAPAPEAVPARTAAAAPAPAEPVLRPPASPPLTTVIFTPRSAELSDGARIALGFFARDPKTRRLRRIELWACSSAEDPADAGKIALARTLAVHAFLIDLGFKGNIEIGGYAETAGSADRVDVMVR